MILSPSLSSFFFFNDTATTEIYTLSLHDALPICFAFSFTFPPWVSTEYSTAWQPYSLRNWAVFCFTKDRKSTRLNSSHQIISYAVFCLKKKKYQQYIDQHALVYFPSLSPCHLCTL